MALFSKERDEARAERDAAISERNEAVKALEEMQGKLTTKEFEVNFLTSQNQQFDTALAGANARITTLEGEKLKAEADLNQFKADFEQKVGAEVIKRCADAGLDNPIAKDPAADKDPRTKPEAGEGLTGLAKARAILNELHKGAK